MIPVGVGLLSSLPNEEGQCYVWCPKCEATSTGDTLDDALRAWLHVNQIADGVAACIQARLNEKTNRPAVESEEGGRVQGRELTQASAAGGTKYSANKPPFHLVNRTAIIRESEVLGWAATEKPRPDGGFGYGTWNWAKGLSWSDTARAAISHLRAWLERDELDAESGKSHIAHARCCTGFLLEFEEFGTGIDDRRPSPGKSLDKQPDDDGSGGCTAVLDDAPGGK